MATFYSPREILNDLKTTLAGMRDCGLICTTLDVRPDWGTHTQTAYEGTAIATHRDGLRMWYWKATCTEDDPGPSISVYHLHSVSSDSPAAPGLPSSIDFLVSVSAVPAGTQWAAPLDTGEPGRWTQAPLRRIVERRYAE